MRLAFDVRSEWRQLLGHLTWQKLRDRWLTRKLRNARGALARSIAQTRDAIDPIGAARGMKRRIVWVIPPVRVRLVGGFSGFLLLCLFLWSGMRWWPSPIDQAQAAPSVARATAPETATSAARVVSATPAPDQAGPSGPGPSASRPGPSDPASPLTNSSITRLTPTDELAQRKAALVEAEQACLARLAGTEPYESAKAHFEQIDARVRELRSHDPFRELPRLSVDWIQAKSDLQKVIDDAMKADPNVVRAKASIKQPRRFR